MAGKPAQTRRERLEAREEAILGAARAAFLESGFDGARMTEIAKRAGVAEGTVYLYFKNKNALLEAVIQDFYSSLTEAARDGVQGVGDTFDRFEFLARHHLTRCLDNWQILDLMIGMYRAGAKYQDQGYQLNKAYVAVFDDVFREGVARGDIREDLALWTVRDLFYGTLEYAARTLVIRGRTKKDLELAVRNTLQILHRGIAADSAPPAESELESITRRLESVAADLEARGLE